MQHNLLCDFSFRQQPLNIKFLCLFFQPLAKAPPIQFRFIFKTASRVSQTNWVSFGSWPKPIRIFGGQPENDKLQQTNSKSIQKGQGPWELWFL